MTEPINAETQDFEDSRNADGSARSGHGNTAVDGGSSKAKSGSASADPAKSGHENYMFGDIHVFVD